MSIKITKAVKYVYQMSTKTTKVVKMYFKRAIKCSKAMKYTKLLSYHRSSKYTKICIFGFSGSNLMILPSEGTRTEASDNLDEAADSGDC
jgi:hypothetical protein